MSGIEDDRLALEIGRALRRARRARGLTLRELTRLSAGRFKATSVAGYERGERTISLERFCDLCVLYGVSPQAVLGDILVAVGTSSQEKIDLTRLETMQPAEGSLLSEFVRHIKALRREAPSGPIALRAGDIEVLATAAGDKPDELAEVTEPAVSQQD
jgi:transcriptional regulator with XRE-family HTH domain